MAAQAEAEEEVRLELEAVAAVYGDDVRVLRDLPPHLVVHVRPRTADDSSQQVRLAAPLPPAVNLSFPAGPSGFPILAVAGCCGSRTEDSRYRSAGWPALWCDVPGGVKVVAGALLELPPVLR
jgi:hypothetical protein